MEELVTSIITGLTAFSATNIDDFVVLLLFFAQVNATFRNRHIVIGQYLGFTVLVIASLPGFFGGLILPRHWLGLLGLVPIAMGISRLINCEEGASAEVEEGMMPSDYSSVTSFVSPQTYSVAIITIANGSDNIGIYVPLFASSDLASILVIISVFFLLLGVWCYSTYKLTNYPVIADSLALYGSTLVPFVLIGLGAFIVFESGSLSITKLIASCLCLLILLKNDQQTPEVNEKIN